MCDGNKVHHHVDWRKLELVTQDPQCFSRITWGQFILNNDQVGQRTKHIDIKWHHVRDMIKDGDLVVMYVRSKDNPADII